MVSELRLKGILNPKNQGLLGTLNIYTMSTGDGRDIELTTIDGWICWRRVGDSNWHQLVSLDDLKPIKGTDYMTEEDYQAMLQYVEDNLQDNLPISAVSGLQGALDSKVEIIDTIVSDTLMVSTEDGSLKCSGIKKEDIATKQDLQSILQDRSYIHRQGTAESTWTIQHNLNKFPSVSVVDSANNLVQGEVTYIDTNTLQLRFTSAFSGKAYIN